MFTETYLSPIKKNKTLLLLLVLLSKLKSEEVKVKSSKAKPIWTRRSWQRFKKLL